MKQCLYNCDSGSPSTQEYHVYPLSASTLDITLSKGVVCNKCNAYFSKLEKEFVETHPGALARLLALKRTRKGKPPVLFTNAGLATKDNENGKSAITIPLEDINVSFEENGNILVKGEVRLPPFKPRIISRVLAKMSLEFLVACMPKLDPYSARFDSLRCYARRGPVKMNKFIWFAFRLVDESQEPPQVIKAESPNEILGRLMFMGFPGIQYLFPLPPFIDSSAMTLSPEWTMVGSEAIMPREAVKIEVPLIKTTPDQEES